MSNLTDFAKVSAGSIISNPVQDGYGVGAGLRTIIFTSLSANTIIYMSPYTGIKAGEIFTIQNRSAYWLTIRAADYTALLNLGYGTVTLCALQDSPTLPAHWCLVSLYDQGSFTPEMRGSVTNPTVGTWTFRYGYWERVGNLVHCTIGLQANYTVNGSGSIYCVGFPFTPLSAGYYGASAAPVTYSVNFANSIHTNFTCFFGYFGGAATDLCWYTQDNGSYTPVSWANAPAGGNWNWAVNFSVRIINAGF